MLKSVLFYTSKVLAQILYAQNVFTTSITSYKRKNDVVCVLYCTKVFILAYLCIIQLNSAKDLYPST